MGTVTIIFIIMKKYYIFPAYLVFLLYVGADLLLDDVLGPFKYHLSEWEYCRITGRNCIDCSVTRRSLRGPDNGWLYNISLRTYFYMKDTTTVRILASSKGSSGHFNNLADITRPVCQWMEWIKPFIKDVAERSGYQPNICLSLIPGLYTATNYLVKSHISKVPIAPYGLYKFEFQLSEKDNSNCHCMRVFINIFPDA